MGWMIQVLVLSIDRDFSFLQIVETGPAAHPASESIVIGLLSLTGKVARV
jgi:hypothetical protein